MEIFKHNSDPKIFIKRYMHGHSHLMIILLEKLTSEEYKVIYANTLAINYFFGSEGKLGSIFFKQYWNDIIRELKLLERDSNLIKEKVIRLNYEEELLEVSMQCSETNVISIEVREVIGEGAIVEELVDLRNKYESVIEHNLDTIMTVNKKGEIIKTNLAVQTVFGYSKSDVLKQTLYKFVKKDQVDMLKVVIKDGFHGRINEITELDILHKENLYLPALIKIIPLFNNGSLTELNVIIRNQSKDYEYNEKFLFLSYRDQLTGLFNRKALKKDFLENRLIAKKTEQKIAIIHIGLDRFKLINESLGHNGADEILKSVGKRLENSCPATCKVYRSGGDEFIVVVNNHTAGTTGEISSLLLEEIGKSFQFNSSEYFISASIGISVFPQDGNDIESLIQKSEQAMFYVKENGRSHYRFYENEMKSLTSDEILLESHLRRAIELDELKVYYQPQINLTTGEVNSFEALLRWNNRKFGFVSPGEFIHIAEDSGLIHSIGDWVLEQVSKQLKEWQEKGFREVSIAVNISPKQFRMARFAKDVRESILKHQIKPCSLELEITENSLANMKETLITLNELKEIGVRISIDDFGTGYSSLSYLKQYPIDIIKIDQSFIKEIEIDEKNQAIAKTIINLAHNLGMEVIAEGVEKSEQADILLAAKCQKAQGFLYSKALPVEELVEKYFIVHVQ